MPTGLAIPVGVTKAGRSALASSDDNDWKILSTSLSDCDNENAFQQSVGIPANVVFDINDPKTRARVMTRLASIFREFVAQNRYKLKRETIKWSSQGEAMLLEFKYLNLESDEEETFSRSFV